MSLSIAKKSYELVSSLDQQDSRPNIINNVGAMFNLARFATKALVTTVSNQNKHN